MRFVYSLKTPIFSGLETQQYFINFLENIPGLDRLDVRLYGILIVSCKKKLERSCVVRKGAVVLARENYAPYDNVLDQFMPAYTHNRFSSTSRSINYRFSLKIFSYVSGAVAVLHNKQDIVSVLGHYTIFI